MGKGRLWPFAQAHHPEALKGCRYGEIWDYRERSGVQGKPECLSAFPLRHMPSPLRLPRTRPERERGGRQPVSNQPAPTIRPVRSGLCVFCEACGLCRLSVTVCYELAYFFLHITYCNKSIFKSYILVLSQNHAYWLTIRTFFVNISICEW